MIVPPQKNNIDKMTISAGINDNGDFHGNYFLFDILLMAVQNPASRDVLNLEIWSGETTLPQLGRLKY